MLIDAKNKLKPEDVSHFLENVKGTIVIAIQSSNNSEMVIDTTTSVKNFVSEILSMNCNDLDIIICSNEDTQLLITGMDINWWKENARRYNKLYKAADEVINAIPAKEYTCGIANLVNDKLDNVKLLHGTKKDILYSLNEEINKRCIDSFLKAKIVINLAYVEADENDITQWLTIDELLKIGAIK